MLVGDQFLNRGCPLTTRYFVEFPSVNIIGYEVESITFFTSSYRTLNTVG